MTTVDRQYRLATSEFQRQRKLREQIARADELGSRYLGNANEARERGDIAEAEKLEAKCQFWLDRSNVLRGCGP